mmetsp:Transcript_88414/g.270616  ORF Transcript_88414/g.270616 Transcript_88414/m.270616 type:complete len:259 (+) Transcript_88414:713-1489(+)
MARVFCVASSCRFALSASSLPSSAEGNSRDTSVRLKSSCWDMSSRDWDSDWSFAASSAFCLCSIFLISFWYTYVRCANSFSRSLWMARFRLSCAFSSSSLRLLFMSFSAFRFKKMSSLPICSLFMIVNFVVLSTSSFVCARSVSRISRTLRCMSFLSWSISIAFLRSKALTSRVCASSCSWSCVFSRSSSASNSALFLRNSSTLFHFSSSSSFCFCKFMTVPSFWTFCASRRSSNSCFWSASWFSSLSIVLSCSSILL